MNAERIDNTLSPHGGDLVDRLVHDEGQVAKLMDKCEGVLRIRGQIAREIVSIAYGFFSPLQGFMNSVDLDSVCRHMTLANGMVWTMPILFDIGEDALKQLGAKKGSKVLLEYHNVPFAVLEVEDVYSFDKSYMAKCLYDADNIDHPGIKQVHALEDKFLGGKVWLINPPVFQEPFNEFFVPPAEMRAKFTRRHWKRVLAFHTTSVPHMGHEYLMKAGWFRHDPRGLLVSCAVGGKSIGDCIDEAVLLGHRALQEAGYFRESMHLTSMVLWDRRYAGPKEAVHHALMRKNLGCTGHIFGKNHAQAPGFGDTWAAHFIFKHLPDLGIESVLTREWFYCKQCDGVTYSGFCGHHGAAEEFKSASVCSLLSTGIRPAEHFLRPEVFDTIIGAADKYGYGDGYVTEEYLQRRNPIFILNKL